MEVTCTPCSPREHSLSQSFQNAFRKTHHVSIVGQISIVGLFVDGLSLMDCSFASQIVANPCR